MADLDNVAVGVRNVPWTGHAVRVQVHDAVVELAPQDAATLSQQIKDAALEAILADRAARRG
jgi:hypothetical protein